MKTAPTLYWIDGPWTGRLAVSARPRGWDWLEDEVAGWRDAGAEAVASLLTPEETAELGLNDEPRLCAAAGLQYFSLPIPDRDIPNSGSLSADFIQMLVRQLERDTNVVVHCRQGIGRSGMIAATVLAAGGIDVEEALKRVAASRGLDIPETAAQLAWVRHMAEVLHQQSLIPHP